MGLHPAMSQRDALSYCPNGDFIPKPGVARNELPRVVPGVKTYLNEVVDGVVSRLPPGPILHNTFGVGK